MAHNKNAMSDSQAYPIRNATAITTCHAYPGSTAAGAVERVRRTCDGLFCLAPAEGMRNRRVRCKTNDANLFVAIPEAPGLVGESAIDVAVALKVCSWPYIQCADRFTYLFVVIRQLCLGQYAHGNMTGVYTLMVIRADDGRVLGSTDLDTSKGYVDAMGFKYPALTIPLRLGPAPR